MSSDVLVRPAAPANPANPAIEGDVVGGGTPLLFLEDDPAYYGPRGLEQASTHGFVPASARTPEDAFQVARFAGHEEWMTGQLIHRDVWWRHDVAGLRDPLLAELERGDR